MTANVDALVWVTLRDDQHNIIPCATAQASTPPAIDSTLLENANPWLRVASTTCRPDEWRVPVIVTPLSTGTSLSEVGVRTLTVVVVTAGQTVGTQQIRVRAGPIDYTHCVITPTDIVVKASEPASLTVLARDAVCLPRWDTADGVCSARQWEEGRRGVGGVGAGWWVEGE